MFIDAVSPSQPQSMSMLPEQAIESVAPMLFNPGTLAAGHGLITEGNIGKKAGVAVDSLGFLIVFQQAAKLANKGLDWLYDNHPELAERIHNHPVIGSLAGLATSAVVAIPAAMMGERMISGARKRFVQPHLDKLSETPLGKRIDAKLAPFSRHKVRYGILAAVGAIGALAVYYYVRDLMGFGQAYQAAREEIPVSQLDPYAMEDLVSADQALPDVDLVEQVANEGDLPVGEFDEEPFAAFPLRNEVTRDGPEFTQQKSVGNAFATLNTIGETGESNLDDSAAVIAAQQIGADLSHVARSSSKLALNA